MTTKAIEKYFSKYSEAEIADFLHTAIYSTDLYIDECKKKEELIELEYAKKSNAFLEEVFNEIMNIINKH